MSNLRKCRKSGSHICLFIVCLCLAFYSFDYFSNILYPLLFKNLQFGISYLKTAEKIFSLDGKPFNKKWNTFLHNLNLLDVKMFITDQQILNSTPIIGTAVSSSHMPEIRYLLESLSKIYDGKKLVYLYDIGISEEENSNLTEEYGSVIREIRKFDFIAYPAYVRRLRDYRWKPLIVAQLLKEFPSMWWMDSSVAVHKPLDHFYDRVRNCLKNESAFCNYSTWTLFTSSGHSIFAATHPAMYDFLPIPLNYTKHLTMSQATLQLIFATKAIRENVLRYWVLCALEEECMAPRFSTVKCVFYGNTYTDYANCNRQDQSAINIILAKFFNFDDSRYSRDTEHILAISRLLI